MAGRGSTGRLLGLGFLFGAKDDGATDTAKAVGEGMDHLADATERASSKTNGLIKFGNAIAGLNFLQLDRIGNAMEGLAEKAGVGPGGAANSIESFGVQFGKSFREATAGLGKYTKGVEKYRGAISGAAFNLEVDAGELTRTTAAFVKQGHALEDYGLTVRSMAGSMQAGILSGDQLAHVLTSLSEGYDLGAKGAGRHLDKITAIGEQFGAGKEAAQGLEAAISAADPVLAKFSNLSVEGVTESITRLAAAGYQRLGGKFEDRMQDAIGVFNELAGAREEMGSLITGLGSDFPMLAKEIGIASGDVGASMEAILQDPLTFAKHMQSLMSSMDKSDPRFQRLKLSLGRLPAGFQFLIDGGQESAKALEEASKPVKNFEGSFSRMAEGSSGAARTFAESMDLLRERHENALNKMTSQTDRQVLKRQRTAYKRLTKTINDMRKRGGPLAGLLQLTLDIRRHGFLHGLIPTIDRFAAGSGPLGKMARKLKSILPMFDGFGEMLIGGALAAGKLAVTIGLLSGPLGKFFGLVKVIFRPLTNLVKRAFSPLSKILGKNGNIQTFFRLAPRLAGRLTVIGTVGYIIYKYWEEFRAVAVEVWNALTDIWGTVSKDLSPSFEALGEIGVETWQIIKDGATVLWDDYLKPLAKWVGTTGIPHAFGLFATLAVASLYTIASGAKWIGTALDAAIGVGIAGFRLLVAYSPIGQMLKAFQMLAEWAGKTDLGKSLGLDKFGEQLAPVTDWISGGNVNDLTRELGRAKRVLGGATDEFWQSYDKGQRKAAESGARVFGVADRAAKGFGGSGASEDEEPPAQSRRVARKRRSRSRAQADRMEASMPTSSGPRDRFAAGGDLAGFLKGVEKAVERGATKGSEEGIKKGSRRNPRAAQPGGAER